MSGANDPNNPKKLTAVTRWIPEKSDNGQAYFSLTMKVTDNLNLGFDLRPLVGELAPIGNWRAISEDPDGWRPALIFGGSRDDFTVDGNETTSTVASAVFAKNLLTLDTLDLNFAPYAGGVWIHELDELRAIGGLAIHHPELSTLIQYSGTDTHLSVTRQLNDSLSVSAIYWGLRYPGVGFRWTF